jgi:hypothetical protein
MLMLDSQNKRNTLVLINWKQRSAQKTRSVLFFTWVFPKASKICQTKVNGIREMN